MTAVFAPIRTIEARMAIGRWIISKRPQSSLADRLIELRSAFEALYLAGLRGELRLRLASYAAWQLGADFNKLRQYFKLVRDAYDRGSAAVHAGEVDDAPGNRDLVSGAQRACREAILKRLEDTEGPRPWDEVVLGAPVPEEDFQIDLRPGRSVGLMHGGINPGTRNLTVRGRRHPDAWCGHGWPDPR